MDPVGTVNEYVKTGGARVVVLVVVVVGAAVVVGPAVVVVVVGSVVVVVVEVVVEVVRPLTVFVSNSTIGPVRFETLSIASVKAFTQNSLSCREGKVRSSRPCG